MEDIKTYEEFTLTLLTEKSVSVMKRTYADIGGTKTQIGESQRKAYANSTIGRQQIIDELPEPYANAVMAVWGDEPTIDDPPAPVLPVTEV